MVSPDLRSWVDWTIKCLQRENGFCLLARVAAGGHLIDWEDQGRNEPIMSRQQIEGYRLVYKIEKDGWPFTMTQTFLQYNDTQVGLCCRAPSERYRHFEELFLMISKELRILGVNSASFARAGKVDRGQRT